MEHINLDYSKPILISQDGRIEEFIPKHITGFEIDELIGVVGGKLEILEVPESELLLIFNEDGKRMNLPLNLKAIEVVAQLTGSRYQIPGSIVISPNSYMGSYFLP